MPRVSRRDIGKERQWRARMLRQRETGLTVAVNPFAIDEFRKILLRQVYSANRPNLKLLNRDKDGGKMVGTAEARTNSAKKCSDSYHC